MKRFLISVAAVTAGIGVVGACTPQEIQSWQAWHAQDPAAAEAYAAGLAAPPAAVPATPGAPAVPAAPADSVWDRIAQCESGGNWSINLGTGYYGGLQFLGSSWRAYGGTEFAPTADQATREQQIVVAERIKAAVGFKAWPACSRKLGLL
jgi:Transglycosylase-like domain